MRAEPGLRLDPRFTHLVRLRDRALLVGDDDPVLLEDPAAAEVVALLDGRRTALDVAVSLEERHAPEVVHFILLSLQSAGVVSEVPPVGAGVEEAEGPLTGLPAELARLWASRGPAPWVDAPDGTWRGPGGCRLRLTDDYLHPGIGTAPGPAGGLVLLAGLGARRIWLGPVLGAPGASVDGMAASCPACLQDRLHLNLVGRALVHPRTGDAEAEGRIVGLRVDIPGAVWRALADALPTSGGGLREAASTLRVIRADPVSPPEDHPVPHLPHCPRCGDPGLRIPGSDLELRSRRRTGGSGGGYRICTPEQTWTRHAHLVSPLTGVVRRVREVTVPGTSLVHVYTASHAHHYGRGSARSVKDGRRDHSGGKGRTDADARASALCESLERFSSVHRGDEPVRVARRSELADDAVAPHDLVHFSEAQYAGREAWNEAQRGGFQRVGEPYRDEPIAWSGARSLASGAVRLVPSAFLYHGFRGPGQEFCDGDSNGLAGGNCLEEAVLQGFLELAERDAVALWWYNRAHRPAVDLDSIGDPWIDGVVEHYGAMERDTWALDLTTDLEIPTYVALSAKRREREQDIIFGFGAHLDPGIALVRAFTELNQMLPAVLEGREARRRRLLPDFPDALRWWDEATLESEPHLRAGARHPAVRLPASPSADGDLRDDVHACVERARSVGCDVLVHDLTRPDVGLPVVKVVAPGLRHFWRRLGPGRLYDVPVSLGWIARPRTEAEMNPVSLFV